MYLCIIIIIIWKDFTQMIEKWELFGSKMEMERKHSKIFWMKTFVDTALSPISMQSDK